jgi:putative peptidoglycan lipid II flippase
MKFAMVAVAVNIALGLVLYRVIGFAGIAAATAVASWINVVMMAATLQVNGHYSPGWDTIVRIRKLIAASVLMGLVMGGLSWLRPHYQHLLLRKEIAVGAAVLVGAAIYLALLFALKAVSMADIRGALKKSPRKPA